MVSGALPDEALAKAGVVNGEWCFARVPPGVVNILTKISCFCQYIGSIVKLSRNR